jgi:hypothetical protein
MKVVLAAVHHAADAIACIAVHDRAAVGRAAADHRLYMPTRLLPENYDIPCRYAPVPSERTDELIAAYDTAARVSRNAAMILDELSVTIGSPAQRSPRSASGRFTGAGAPADRESPNAKLPKPASPRDPRGQVGEIEHILRSLQITEPAMLLRAAAIDGAAHDVLAHASRSSRNRETIDHPRYSRNVRPRARK